MEGLQWVTVAARGDIAQRHDEVRWRDGKGAGAVAASQRANRHALKKMPQTFFWRIPNSLNQACARVAFSILFVSGRSTFPLALGSLASAHDTPSGLSSKTRHEVCEGAMPLCGSVYQQRNHEAPDLPA